MLLLRSTDASFSVRNRAVMSKCHCVGGPDERTTLPGFGVIVGDAILPQVAHDGRVRPNNRTQENHKKRKHQRGKKKKWNQAICTRVQKYKLIPSVLSLTLDTFSQFSLKSRNGKEIEKRDSSDRKWELCGGWTERQFSVCSNLYRGVNTSSATTNSHMWANTAASALRYAIQIP